MKVIDISWPLFSGTTEYKDKKSLAFQAIKEFDKDGVRDAIITMGTHTGTHVDAPAHFLKDGKTIDQIGLGALIGQAHVVNCITAVDTITMQDLQNIDIKQHEIVLLRTSNSALSPHDPFKKDFIYLDASAARFLVEKKVKAVGIDYLGIERGNSEHPTHTIFMHHDIPIIEGLRLAHVQPGYYFFICLPLSIIGLEAAPARAILMTE